MSFVVNLFRKINNKRNLTNINRIEKSNLTQLIPLKNLIRENKKLKNSDNQ